MGHVVHEPWPLIASKHALRIIPADSRQTAVPGPTTKPADETGQTNKRRGATLNVDACRPRIRSGVSCFQTTPSPSPSLRACLRVCARVRYNAPTATTPDILLRSSINSLLKSYQGEDLPAVGSLDSCSACLTRMITCCHRRSTFHACRETVFGLFRTTIFHSYRDDRKCTYFKEG